MAGAVPPLRAVGPSAVLVELDDLAQVHAARRVLADAAAAGTLPGIVDLVPAARTVLVTARPGVAPGEAVRAVLADADLAAPDPAPGSGAVVELAVHYDGEDLELVATDAGTTPEDVVARHTARELTVAFGGFAPGFAYLSGLDPALCQPRLARPRERIPSGAVGVAGEFSGVYPRASPGGWRLIGRLAATAPVLFDPERDPPALLTAGTRVRFQDADR